MEAWLGVCETCATHLGMGALGADEGRAQSCGGEDLVLPWDSGS